MKDVNADPNGSNGGPGYKGGAWEFYFSRSTPGKNILPRGAVPAVTKS
jgi:hypothetical protein